ncbi:LysR substrate-binding domain-containing protein [Arenibaculum sp.]|jgi:LysR family glycine cleavage system transcriptional activator|uniref:LysR substrate-binding domain-containing protein n=1 Tax=Arenibaculum sp. TaxID=2865862 RepID=UPI002E13C24C|nr:LysR substrate-binding domain-containing protein [Arenibaculum sp.]
MAISLTLIGLRAFVEVGRRGSVKKAAEVLYVTPGAVSQQLKHLEQQLGAALFERCHRQVRLTPAGTRLYEPLAEAFQVIEDTLAAFEPQHVSRGQGTLTITTDASFAATWLVPRLGRFAERHPRIEVRVETASGMIDLRRETQVDVALRQGPGDYSGLETVQFLAPRLVPVCAPALLAQGPPLHEPADCLAYPLLQDCDRTDWTLWLGAHGLKDERAQRGPSFADDFLLIRASVAGQGIALVHDAYAEEEIAAGRLVVALDQPCPAPFAYHFIARREAMQRAKVAAFRDWILDEASRTP